MEAPKVNKAKEIRDRQNFEYINTSLRSKLVSFENRFLGNSVKHAIGEYEVQIRGYKKLIKDFPTREVTRRNQSHTVEMYERDILRVEKYLENFNMTITMKALNNAKKSYDERINKLVKILVEEGFGHAHYKIEMIKSVGSELAFLISKSDKEVHARLIFVDGVLVCPHFRFITTTRAI